MNFFPPQSVYYYGGVMDLIEQWQAGKEGAFEAIFHRYKGMVFKAAFLILGDAGEAEGVLQEVFLKVYRSNGRFEGQEPEFRAWLHRITANQCLTCRRKKQLPVLSLDQLLDEGDPLPTDGSKSPEVLLIKEEEKREIRQMLRCLNEDHRLTMVLRYYYELSYEEIAQALKIPLGTVKSRLSNAIKTLRRESVRSRENTARGGYTS
jgi:RNA polymerase sigma-70 factor (ECF subfamily)